MDAFLAQALTQGNVANALLAIAVVALWRKGIADEERRHVAELDSLRAQLQTARAIEDNTRAVNALAERRLP